MKSTLLPIGALLLAFALHSPATRAGEPSSAKLARRCDKGQANACVDLAARWNQAAHDACADGAIPACLGLATAQLEGLGQDDPQRALVSYDGACFMGIEAACQRLNVIRAIGRNPNQPTSPLTLHISPAGLSLEGAEAALLSTATQSGGSLEQPCTVHEGCTRKDHFDWDALSSSLEQIAASDPTRTQAVLRPQGVDYDAMLEAARHLAGPDDAPLFPHVVIVEVAP